MRQPHGLQPVVAGFPADSTRSGIGLRLISGSHSEIGIPESGLPEVAVGPNGALANGNKDCPRFDFEPPPSKNQPHTPQPRADRHNPCFRCAGAWRRWAACAAAQAADAWRVVHVQSIYGVCWVRLRIHFAFFPVTQREATNGIYILQLGLSLTMYVRLNRTSQNMHYRRASK